MGTFGTSNCTCQWSGDDHYSKIIWYNKTCPTHNAEWQKNLEEEQEKLRNKLRNTYRPLLPHYEG